MGTIINRIIIFRSLHLVARPVPRSVVPALVVTPLFVTTARPTGTLTRPVTWQGLSESQSGPTVLVTSQDWVLEAS